MDRRITEWVGLGPLNILCHGQGILVVDYATTQVKSDTSVRLSQAFTSWLYHLSSASASLRNWVAWSSAR